MTKSTKKTAKKKAWVKEQTAAIKKAAKRTTIKRSNLRAQANKASDVKAVVQSPTESRILDLEMRLEEEKAAHTETKRKLKVALADALPLPPARTLAPDHLRGPTKLGFERKTVEGRVVEVPDPDERRLVRACLKLVQAKGLTGATHILNDKGILVRGKPWSPSKIAWAKAQAAAWEPA